MYCERVDLLFVGQEIWCTGTKGECSRETTVNKELYTVQGSHGHDISGKVLKLENTISSTGNVLELSKSWSRSWKVLELFVYALFLAIDFVKK